MSIEAGPSWTAASGTVTPSDAPLITSRGGRRLGWSSRKGTAPSRQVDLAFRVFLLEDTERLRAFVQVRELLASNRELAQRLDQPDTLP